MCLHLDQEVEIPMYVVDGTRFAEAGNDYESADRMLIYRSVEGRVQ